MTASALLSRVPAKTPASTLAYLFARSLRSESGSAAKSGPIRFSQQRGVGFDPELACEQHPQEINPNTSPQTTAASPSWDFSKLSIFGPRQRNAPPGSPRRASPLASPIRPKLVIGDVDDPLEHEADRMADHVMRMLGPLAPTLTGGDGAVRRKCAACEEDNVRLRADPNQSPSGPRAGEAPALVHEVLASAGRPLEPATRAFFEPRFGRDFSAVRVHSDARAMRSARAVDAHAFTVGHHVVFGQARYDPETRDGKYLIAHELAHVVQAGGAAPSLRRQNGATEEPASASAAGSAGGGGRPVFFCSKPILLSFLHGKRHAFFRLGGSSPGNDTYELEHAQTCPDCYQGFPRKNEPEDRDATDAICNPAPAISASCLDSSWSSYPIGQYCSWGPNSNTYARVIEEKCGGTGLRPPGDVPGFDDPPPFPGTFGPNPYLFSALGICWSPGGCDLCQQQPEAPPGPSPA
jgi:hypothetical protein